VCFWAGASLFWLWYKGSSCSSVLRSSNIIRSVHEILLFRLSCLEKHHYHGQGHPYWEHISGAVVNAIVCVFACLGCK
jgi:hypothetical protein